MSTLQQSLHQRRAAEVAVIACVTTQERQSALIVSAWEGDSWVLPWAQFASARFSGNRIELSFANCLVIVTGQNLHALLDDIAAYRIGSLRELPADYHQKPSEGEPFISRIEVQPHGGASKTLEVS